MSRLSLPILGGGKIFCLPLYFFSPDVRELSKLHSCVHYRYWRTPEMRAMAYEDMTGGAFQMPDELKISRFTLRYSIAKLTYPPLADRYLYLLAGRIS